MGTAVQFRILGPLEASRDGAAVRLGGERQRALLALLLVHTNRLVATETLVAELFGDTPSAGAVNAVQAGVSRLRRALGDGSGAVLATRPGGYMLVAHPAQLDAARFEQLLSRGRALLTAGDCAAAEGALREALALWRGPALGAMAMPDGVAAEIRRLEELRLLALTARIDADLALGRDAELIGELEKAVADHPWHERLREQLMLALYRCGRQADALAVYRDASERLRSELGIDPTPALQRLERMVLRQDTALGADGPAPGAGTGPGSAGSAPSGDGAPAAASAAAVCPFKGLAFFDGTDAEFFCGRERSVSELVAQLAESTLVGILGPSGIGKSSLLRAGLLPALAAGALPRSARWRQVLLRPGEHPVQELARAVGGPGLGPALRALGDGERLVVAVDQLEELFTVCTSEAERAAFLGELAAAARDHRQRAVMVCALRADFYGRFGVYDQFAELLSHNHRLLGPMDRDELAEAIDQPARRAGLEVERPLIEALVAEVAEQPGGLPLLSTTLLELWQARDGRTLRYAQYRVSGGVRGAVARLAEAAYARLTAAEQRVARGVMLRLVGGEEGALVRRRVPLEEVQRVTGAARVLATLVDARLLTVAGGEVELCHEALLREWPRYQAWLEEDRGQRRLRQHLIAAAREWELGGRHPDELYRGPRLTGAVQWASASPTALNSLEREFLRASRGQAGRDARRQRSLRRRLRTLVAAAGVLLVVAVAAGLVALAKERSASRAARVAAADARAALGRQLGAEAVSEPSLDLAMLLAREAVRLDLSPETEGTLMATLLRSPAVIGTFTPAGAAAGRLAISPDGATLAVGEPGSGTIGFYDPRTRRPSGPPVSGLTGDQGAAYSPDGRLVLSPTEQGAQPMIAVRDARTHTLVRELALDARPASEVTADIPGASIFVSPDDRTAYYAYWVLSAGRRPARAFVDRWSLAGGRLLSSTPLGAGPLLAVRLVAGGAHLVVVSARAVSVFDARTLRAVHAVALAPAPAQPTTAAVSPDGRTVAIGDQSGAVSLASVATGAVRIAHGAHHAAVVGAFFSPAGQAVTTVGDDSTVLVWDPATGAETQSLSGPAGQVRSAALSPDGTTLYTSTVAGGVLVWDLTGSRRFGDHARLGAGLPCCSALTPTAPPVAVSPDGTRFAARIGASSVGVFDTGSLRPRVVFTITPRGEGITALAWSPAAPVLAVAGHSGFVQLWNVAGRPRQLRSLVGLHALVGRPEAIQALAFSPDGRTLAASDENETRSSPSLPALPAAFLALWRTSDGALIAAPRDLEVGSGPNGSDALAFARGGGLLAASLPDGRVLVLDPVSGDVVETLDPASGATSLAFSPGGALATGTAAGTVELFDPVNGRRLAPALIAGSPAVTSIAFDAGGRHFATTGYHDGAVKLWSTSSLQQEGPALSAGQGADSTAVFAAGGRLLVVEDRGDAYSWPTALGSWQRRACAVAGRNLTRPEWARLIARPHTAPICP